MKEYLNPNSKEISAQKKNQEIIDSYDYLDNAACVNDCTGLIPVAPTSKAELESYNDIYSFEPHVPKKSEDDVK